MKRRHTSIILLALIALATLTCNPIGDSSGSQGAEDQVATSVAQTVVALGDTPTAPHDERPTIVPTPTKVPSPTTLPPTDTPKPAPTGDPTVTPTEQPEPEVAAELKEELFFAGGGAGFLCEFVDSPPAANLPAIVSSGRVGNAGALCMFGFPLGDELTVDIRGPDNNYSGSVTLWVESEVEGITLAELAMWWPVGLPTGPWSAVVRSYLGEFGSLFEIEPYHGPAISAVPNAQIGPLESSNCALRRYPADPVFIRGTNFEPNQPLPLGIYYAESDLVDSAKLIHSETVIADDRGEFTVPFYTDASDPSGYYYAVVVLDPAADAIMMMNYGEGLAGPTDCFVVQ